MKYSIIMLFMLAVLLIFISACSSQNPPVPDGKYDALAKCLTANNVTMYGTTWCSHCNNQKQTFGSSFSYVHFVDCDKSVDVCKAAGVEGYPTWSIKGKNYAGEQNIYDLAKNSGCLDTLN